MKEKKIIHNTFFDLIAMVMSFLFGFFRSFKLMISSKNIKRNRFFDVLDFILSKWPKYFWKKPSLFKLMAFPGDIINSIFKKK